MNILMLTVGKNVLPVAVAATYLLEKPGASFDRIRLIHSPESECDAKRLQAFLNKRGYASDVTTVAAGPSNDATNIIDGLDQTQTTAHLHYSGGTTPMAFKAKSAIHRMNPTFSYLSLHSNRLQDEAGNDIYRGDLRRYFAGRFTVVDIAGLHGWTTVTHFNGRRVPSTTDMFASIPAFPMEPANWSNNRLRAVAGRKLPLNLPPFPHLDTFRALLPSGAISFEDSGAMRLTLDEGSSLYWDLRDYFLPSAQFESQVACALRAAIANMPEPALFTEPLRNLYFARRAEIKEEKESCEIDLVFLFGYQLILVSSTTGKDAKLKAFESLHHARQLGGANARALVISNRSNYAKDDEDSLRLDIGLRSGDTSLQIWGSSITNNLPFHFENYLRELTLDRHNQ